jgi:hypothetical protein
VLARAFRSQFTAGRQAVPFGSTAPALMSR